MILFDIIIIIRMISNLFFIFIIIFSYFFQIYLLFIKNEY